MKSLKIMVSMFLLVLAPVIGQAQINVGDPWEFYVRNFSNASASGISSFNIRPIHLDLADSVLFHGNHPWAWRLDGVTSLRGSINQSSSQNRNEIELFFYTPEFRITNNTRFAWGANDGAMWQGKGLNQSHTMGIGGFYKGLSVAFRPQLVFAENKFFELDPFPPRRGLNEYAITRLFVDMPQRMGPDPYMRFDLGNSFVKYSLKGYEGGISNESYWLGPGVMNSFMLSNNAPGFSHAFLGTDGVKKIPSGNLESRWFWGGLRESDFFDDDPDNNLRYITGITLNYSPDYIRGLHVGINRITYRHYPKDGLTISDLFLAFKRIPAKPSVTTGEVDVYRQRMTMTSLFLRYVMPKSGLEWYVEWGRSDYKRGLRDFIGEINLNRAYTAGVIKTFRYTDTRALNMLFEVNQLENNTPGAIHRTSSDLLVNDNMIWYMNNYIRQGYSNRGEVLGAAIGPGSSSQTLRFTYFDRFGFVGVTLNRTAYLMDRLYTYWSYYQMQQPTYWNNVRQLSEIELSYAINALVFLPHNLEFQVDYRVGYLDNWRNIRDNDTINTNVSFTLRYSIRKLSIGRVHGNDFKFWD